MSQVCSINDTASISLSKKQTSCGSWSLPLCDHLLFWWDKMGNRVSLGTTINDWNAKLLEWQNFTFCISTGKKDELQTCSYTGGWRHADWQYVRGIWVYPEGRSVFEQWLGLAV